MTTYNIAVGRSRTDTSWTNCAKTWADIKVYLAHPKRTYETMAEYRASAPIIRNKIKDVGGFVGGTLSDGHRKADTIVSRSLLTLDIDNGKETTLGEIEDFMAGTAWCLYSTHSHTQAKPRYRLVVPLSREVTPDEYVPVARRLAAELGIEIFDPSTYEPCRLMYWPSVSQDGVFVYRDGDGDPYDADKALGTYRNWRDASEWPKASSEATLRAPNGAKLQDPTDKQGIIGAFCREYDIHKAIATFLSDVYVPTARTDRYTYTKGSTAQGLVVYDDGKFAYSNHGTDPAYGKGCNAFDLVRIHKFGALDTEASLDAPDAKLPSVKAMTEFAEADRAVRARKAQETYDQLQSDYANVSQIDSVARSKEQVRSKAKPEQSATWMTRLKTVKGRQEFTPTPENFGLICSNDPALAKTVRRDLFAHRDRVVADLPWRKASEDTYWRNSDDAGLIDYVSAHYGIVNKTALLDAQELAVSKRGYHPVKDWLSTLTWDGTPRLDTLLIDYLGAADNALTRAMTRKHLTAAVARILRPGTKYDYILALVGREALGKSTLIKVLAGEWFSDSLTTIEGKDGMEALMGKWLIEIGELTSYKKSTAEAYKAFLSKQEDTYRPAYARKTEVYPRQCVFFATTNERDFLKGYTGNRRFWVVECGMDISVQDVWDDLAKNRDQIWAEAKYRYEQGETLYLDPDMEVLARQRQEEHNEVYSDERKGVIRDFVYRKLPDDWYARTPERRRDYFRQRPDSIGPYAEGDKLTMQREYISAIEVLHECFGIPMDDKSRYKTRELNEMMRELSDCLEPMPWPKTIPGYGRQRCFKILDKEDIK